MELIVKDTFKKQPIAFGKNALPLGERSQKELHELALSALHPDGEVKDSFIAQMFEGDLKDLDRDEVEDSLKGLKDKSFKKKAPESKTKVEDTESKSAASKGATK